MTPEPPSSSSDVQTQLNGSKAFFAGLASLCAVLVVLLVGVLAAVMPFLGDIGLVAALLFLPFVYGLGLSRSARWNAKHSAPSEPNFDQEKFDSFQSGEAALNELVGELDNTDAPATDVLSRIRAQLDTWVAEGRQPTRHAIVNLILQEMHVPAVKLEHYYDRVNAILGTLQSRIGDEFDDTHTRTGWLMAAQAILLTAFVSVLKATDLPPDVVTPLRNAIPALGALIAVVLSFAIFHGHALINRLKDTRAQVEEITHTQYGIPRNGVPTRSPVHRYGYVATKALPSVAFVGWTVLLGIALFQPEHFRMPPVQPDVGAQLIAMKPSPPFAWSESTFLGSHEGCSPDSSQSAEDWAREVLTSWRRRPTKSQRDGLLLVGSTDRTRLSNEGARRYDSNTGLARARVEAVRELLADTSKSLGLEGADALTRDRILTQVTGPEYTPPQTAGPGDPGCTEPALIFDRSVTAWIAIR